MKNRFKSIIATDRYGVQYVKNFHIMATGSVSVQHWTSENKRVKTTHLKEGYHDGKKMDGLL